MQVRRRRRALSLLPRWAAVARLRAAVRLLLVHGAGRRICLSAVPSLESSARPPRHLSTASRSFTRCHMPYTSSMSLSIRGTMLSPSPCRLARQGRPPSQQWYPPPCSCRHRCPARHHTTAHAQNHHRRQVHPQQAQVRQSTGARTYCSTHSLRVAKPAVCTQPSFAAEDATNHSEQ